MSKIKLSQAIRLQRFGVLQPHPRRDDKEPDLAAAEDESGHPGSEGDRSSEDGDGVRREFPGVLATDAEVVHFFWEVGLIRLSLQIDDSVVSSWGLDSVPFLRDHARTVDAVIGDVRDFAADAGQLRATFAFDEDETTYARKVERGTLRSVSVGADVYEVELVEIGDDATLPLYRATQWAPVEGSLVWAGADPAAQLNRSKQVNPEEIRQYLADKGLDDETINKLVRSQEQQPAQPAAAEPAPTQQKPPAPHVDADTILAGLARMLSEQKPATDTAPVKPAADDGALDRAIGAALRQGVPAEVVKRAADEAQGDAERFGVLVRHHKEKTQSVPDAGARVTGGTERKHEAYGDLVSAVVVRGGRGTEDDRKRLSRAGIDPHRETLWSVVERAWRAQGNDGVIVNKEDVLREMMATRTRTGEVKVGMHGARFVRDASGGLVPADLPSAFADILHNMAMGSYMRHMLPFEELARRMDASDLREHKVTWWDIAGSFNPLAKGENLNRVTLREVQGSHKVEPYGHAFKIEWAAIVNDYLGMVTEIPARMGDWFAAQETRVFTETITTGELLDGTSLYTGDFDLAVADPSDFETHLETVRLRALDAVPVAAGAGEDPANDPGATYALEPNRMLYAKELRKAWDKYAGPIDQLDSRTERRMTYETTLWTNSYEALYVPEEHYYLYPGPESPFCPIAYGRLQGQSMTMDLRDTGPWEQDGLIVRVQNTFGATMVKGGVTYRVRSQTSTETAPPRANAGA